ncbi:hypothetical protein HMPREF9959_1769 [Streptococcus mitis SK569]|nr:hypothetical protein HMPREF9959_1769 [Streptococcus mitis SK569]
MDEMKFSTEKGFIVYEKCGIIEIEKVPRFGEITLVYSDGKFTHLVKKELKISLLRTTQGHTVSI